MSAKKNSCLFLTFAVVLALSALPAYSSTTNCPSAAAVETSYTGASWSSGNTTIIAVASNFTGPMATVLSQFVTANPTYKVIMCGDSTGNIEATINASAQPPVLKYSMFFAADKTPDDLYGDNYTTFQYALGTPVIFGYPSGSGYAHTVSGVSDLISGTVTSNTVSASPAGLSSYAISSTLTSGSSTVDIADPAKAPYGLAAQTILTHMGYTVTTSSTPAWLVSPITTYANITNAYNAVGGTTTAGFVSKAQICNHLADGTIVWVQFTHKDLSTDQWAVNFNKDTVGNDLHTYIYNQMNSGTTPTTWNAFITGACYTAI